MAFAEKYKYKISEQNKKSNNLIFKTGYLILQSSFAAVLTGIFTYPYDLVLTRKITCNRFKTNNPTTDSKFNNKSNIKSFKDYLNYEKEKKPRLLFRYYEGFCYSFVEGFINSASLILFYSLYKINSNNDNSDKNDKKNLMNKFFYSSLAGLSASLLSYPFNTVTKFVQVREIEVFGSFHLKKFLYGSTLSEKFCLYK